MIQNKKVNFNYTLQCSVNWLQLFLFLLWQFNFLAMLSLVPSSSIIAKNQPKAEHARFQRIQISLSRPNTVHVYYRRGPFCTPTGEEHRMRIKYTFKLHAAQLTISRPIAILFHTFSCCPLADNYLLCRVAHRYFIRYCWKTKSV